jgi:hypothetical protein
MLTHNVARNLGSLAGFVLYWLAMLQVTPFELVIADLICACAIAICRSRYRTDAGQVQLASPPSTGGHRVIGCRRMASIPSGSMMDLRRRLNLHPTARRVDVTHAHLSSLPFRDQKNCPYSMVVLKTGEFSSAIAEKRCDRLSQGNEAQNVGS